MLFFLRRHELYLKQQQRDVEEYLPQSRNLSHTHWWIILKDLALDIPGKKGKKYQKIINAGRHPCTNLLLQQEPLINYEAIRCMHAIQIFPYKEKENQNQNCRACFLTFAWLMASSTSFLISFSISCSDKRKK